MFIHVFIFLQLEQSRSGIKTLSTKNLSFENGTNSLTKTTSLIISKMPAEGAQDTAEWRVKVLETESVERVYVESTNVKVEIEDERHIEDSVNAVETTGSDIEMAAEHKNVVIKQEIIDVPSEGKEIDQNVGKIETTGSGIEDLEEHQYVVIKQEIIDIPSDGMETDQNVEKIEATGSVIETVADHEHVVIKQEIIDVPSEGIDNDQNVNKTNDILTEFENVCHLCSEICLTVDLELHALDHIISGDYHCIVCNEEYRLDCFQNKHESILSDSPIVESWKGTTLCDYISKEGCLAKQESETEMIKPPDEIKREMIEINEIPAVDSATFQETTIIRLTVSDVSKQRHATCCIKRYHGDKHVRRLSAPCEQRDGESYKQHEQVKIEATELNEFEQQALSSVQDYVGDKEAASSTHNQSQFNSLMSSNHAKKDASSQNATTCDEHYENEEDLNDTANIADAALIKRPYICMICNKGFSRAGYLKSHIYTHNSGCSFKCSKCDKTFARKQNLMVHMKRYHTYTSSEMYPCSICNKEFTKIDIYKRHMSKHTGIGYFECTVCKKTWKTRANLERHMNSHTAKRHRCYICDKMFSSTNSLKVHMYTHTGEKSYSCTICNKIYCEKRLLRVHMFTHTGIGKFSCVICDKQFYSKSQMKLHMCRHTGEKQHVCGICNESFFVKTSLHRHMYKHNGEKPYECLNCGKSFVIKQDLGEHMKIHTIVRPHVCPVCNTGFTTGAYLNRHVKCHNDKAPHVCPTCKLTFISKVSLAKHIQRQQCR